MFSRVGQFHRREGVAPWLLLVTIFGILALVLSMMTLTAAPTQAEEGPEADVLDTSEELDDGLESEVVEDDSLSGSIEQLGESLNGLAEDVKSSGFNSDIDVEISEIVAVKSGKDIERGDKVIVRGSWDAAGIDEAEGTSWWVTFPRALKLDGNSLPYGYEQLPNANASNGFSYDVADDASYGKWEVEAEVVEDIDADSVNFRTSVDADVDVAVDLPESTAPSKAPKQATRMAATADSGAIEVTVDKITNSPVVDPETQLHIGDKARVEGSWKATSTLAGGESFSVGFPAALRIPTGFRFDVQSDGAGDIEPGIKIGECVVNADNSFTCTLNDEVADKDEVQGTWWIEATATQYTDSQSIEFAIPGDVVRVPLPGDGGGIDDGTGPMVTQKTGEVLEDHASIRWTVDIAGPLLVALDSDDEDGTVVLEDTLSDNLQFCRPNHAKLFAGRPGAQEQVGTVTIEGNNLAISLDDGDVFRSKYLYSVEYMTCTPDGSLIMESEIDGYTNSVTIGEQTVDGVIGEYSEWQPDELHKSGYLHGVTDRFQKATWNIIDNGADLQQFDEIP